MIDARSLLPFFPVWIPGVIRVENSADAEAACAQLNAALLNNER